jgi:hypothetical protein
MINQASPGRCVERVIRGGIRAARYTVTTNHVRCPVLLCRRIRTVKVRRPLGTNLLGRGPDQLTGILGLRDLRRCTTFQYRFTSAINSFKCRSIALRASAELRVFKAEMIF